MSAHTGASLEEDIRAAIDAAIRSGDVLHIPDVAKQLAARHPKSGRTIVEISELLFEAGVHARVPLEWDGKPT